MYLSRESVPGGTPRTSVRVSFIYLAFPPCLRLKVSCLTPKVPRVLVLHTRTKRSRARAEAKKSRLNLHGPSVQGAIVTISTNPRLPSRAWLPPAPDHSADRHHQTNRQRVTPSAHSEPRVQVAERFEFGSTRANCWELSYDAPPLDSPTAPPRHFKRRCDDARAHVREKRNDIGIWEGGKLSWPRAREREERAQPWRSLRPGRRSRRAPRSGSRSTS